MARRVLFVGGDAQILAELGEYLDRRDSEVESVGYCDDALPRLRRQPFDLVLVLSLNTPWRTWSSLSSPTPRNIASTSAIVFLKQMRGLYIQVPWPGTRTRTTPNGWPRTRRFGCWPRGSGERPAWR